MINHLRYFLQQYRAQRCHVTIKGFELISRGSYLQLEEHSKLRHAHVELPKRDTPMRMGAYSYVRSESRILWVDEIGRYCSIGRGVTLGETPRNHPVDWVSTSLSVSHQYEPTLSLAKIGHDVWIGHGAVIMAGVKVGHGAIIARNAVVTKDVEPYQIVGGNPAKPIRFRFDEDTRKALLASEWWNLENEALRALPFADVEAFLKALVGITDTAHYRHVILRNRRIVKE